jgi:hypothetical protein
MGRGEKTGVIILLPGETGIPEQMPQGIGAFTVYRAPGDKFKVRRGLGIGETVIFPAEKFKKITRRGYALEKLGHIYANAGHSAVTGEGVYPYLHRTRSITRLEAKGKSFFWGGLFPDL